MCVKCVKNARHLSPPKAEVHDTKESNDLTDQRKLDAELLIKDWYNIKSTSCKDEDKDRRESTALDSLWLPTTPVNFSPEDKKDDAYLTTIKNDAIEDVKDDKDFARMLDFIDKL